MINGKWQAQPARSTRMTNDGWRQTTNVIRALREIGHI
jgi:hypothetical protein